MKEELVVFLRQIKIHPSLLSLGETQTKTGIIEPILRYLGWDTSFAASEVMLEYPVGQGRIDYCLSANQANLVFLEAKKTAEDLDNNNHQDQLLGYAFRHGIKLAVLTNGIKWYFYLPLAEGKWEQRRFCMLDLYGQDMDVTATRLIDFLSRDNVVSGYAIENAKILLDSKRRQISINNSIPQAWNRIVGEPDSRLIDLLSEHTNDICGFRPAPEDIAAFFQKNADGFLLRPAANIPDNSRPQILSNKTDHAQIRKIQREQIPIADADKIANMDLIFEIIRILQSFGGRAPKEQIEQQIFEKYEQVFSLPYYQQKVSHGISRWKHNVAWAKEDAKGRGLVKWPDESGRGIWELTDQGLAMEV